MMFWSSFKTRKNQHWSRTPASEPGPASPYVAEYVAAIDRTERFGFEAPPRVLVRKDCVDMKAVLPVLLDYYQEHSCEDLLGQTAAIHFALVPRLYRKTGIPFTLTIGWMVRQGKPIFQHDEQLISRFVAGGSHMWIREGCPFHLWLTSPACEVLDVTYALNLGCAHTREECAKLIVYQSAHVLAGDSVYHPTLVGPDFFRKTGAVL